MLSRRLLPAPRWPPGLTLGVRANGPRGEVAKLDEVLRSYLQHLAPAVKFRDGCRGDRVGHIGPIG
jgi:hypothetical protein